MGGCRGDSIQYYIPIGSKIVGLIMGDLGQVDQ